MLLQHAVDLGRLAGAQALVRIEAPRAFEQALAPQHLVAAGDAAVEGVRDIEDELREPGPDGPRFVSNNAKRARGMMARWLCEHHVTDVEAMRGFDSNGYRFDASESEIDRWCFNRA